MKERKSGANRKKSEKSYCQCGIQEKEKTKEAIQICDTKKKTTKGRRDPDGGSGGELESDDTKKRKTAREQEGKKTIRYGEPIAQNRRTAIGPVRFGTPKRKGGILLGDVEGERENWLAEEKKSEGFKKYAGGQKAKKRLREGFSEGGD